MRIRERDGVRRAASPGRRGLLRALAGTAAIGAAATLGAAALWTRRQKQEAERRHPPIGEFIDVDGVRLHYVARGQGEPLLLIHGNGTLVHDFAASGLIDDLAREFRVIAIDRPGFGYSTRLGRFWTPRAYARLFDRALARLGVRDALVLGHSWGALVAAALAVHHPARVRGLVLLSGYYYPTLRLDDLAFSPPAVPLLGDAARHTIVPPVAYAITPRVIELSFRPAPVPERFQRLFPEGLVLRPLHLRAIAEDAAMMTLGAMSLCTSYGQIDAPVAILAGDEDRIVDVGRHSARLHRDVPGSTFTALPGLGHMVQHLAQDAIGDAVRDVARRAREREGAAR